MNMNRRKSFKTAIGCFIATIVGKCIALGEITKFYWPGHFSPESLRRHLATDEKHHFGWEKVKNLTFQEMIDLHDDHHWKLGMKSKTPWPNGKQIPGTVQGRGPVSVKPDAKPAIPESTPPAPVEPGPSV